MMKNYEYFKRKRANDPTYAVDDAVKEWLAAHPDDAVGLAEKIWPYSDVSKTFPMTYDRFEEFIGSYEPFVAFIIGYYTKKFSFDEPYFQIDDHENIRSFDEDGYRKECLSFMEDFGIYGILEDASYSGIIPRELKQIIALWSDRSANLRPRSVSKTRAKSSARKQPSKSSNAKSRNAKASPNRKPSQARRR